MYNSNAETYVIQRQALWNSDFCGNSPKLYWSVPTAYLPYARWGRNKANINKHKPYKSALRNRMRTMEYELKFLPPENRIHSKVNNRAMNQISTSQIMNQVSKCIIRGTVVRQNAIFRFPLH